MSNVLSVDDVLNVKDPADRVPFSLSNDGRWLAFTLNGLPKNKSNLDLGVSQAIEGNQQWVCDLFTGRTLQVEPKASSSWSGVWSPASNSLAFYADIEGGARLYFWNPETEKTKLASDVIVRPFFGFEKPIWINNGKHIIIKTMPNKEINDSVFNIDSVSNPLGEMKTSRVQVYSTEEEIEKDSKLEINSWIDRYRGEIVLIEVDTGKSVAICSGFRPVGISVSSDEKYLAFTNCVGQENKDTQQIIYDLWIWSLVSNNAEPYCIQKNIRMTYGLTFSWASNNRSICYTTSGPLADGCLYLIDIENNNPRSVITDKGFDRDYDSPISYRDGDVVFVSKGSCWHYQESKNKIREISNNIHREIISVKLLIESADIILQTFEPNKAHYGFWKVNLETDKVEKLIEEPRKHLPWFEGGAAVSENCIVYLSESYNEPFTISVFNYNRTNSIIRLSDLYSKKLGSAKLLNWDNGGKKLKGALLLPPEGNGPFPVVVRVYGGAMQSSHLRSFGLSRFAIDNHQLFASRGYAVFLPDLPMETNNEPAEEILSAIKDALNELVEHPEIDSERIGIIGHSFGGYSTLVAISRLDLFKAAVVSAGIGNLISFYTHFDPEGLDVNYGWTESGQGDMGCTLWQDRDRYIRNSPLFDFHKINCPVLIVQGTKDPICSQEAGPIYSSLRRLGKTAELVLYDEDHWQGEWDKENIIDYYERVFAWFEKYL